MHKLFPYTTYMYIYLNFYKEIIKSEMNNSCWIEMLETFNLLQ